MTKRLSVPGADVHSELFGRLVSHAKQRDTVQMPSGQKWAIIYVPLAAAVDQDNPAHYLVLKDAIEAISGVQEGISLVIDGQVPDPLPYDEAAITLAVQVRLLPTDPAQETP